MSTRSQERNAQLEVEMYEASNVPMARCHICSRSFREDRIAKHSGVCAKSFGKKRKAFNVANQRMVCRRL